MNLDELVEFVETKSPPGSMVEVYYRREGALFVRPGFVGLEGASSEIQRDSVSKRRDRQFLPEEYRDEAPVGEPYLDLHKYAIRDGSTRGKFPIEARMIESIRRLDDLPEKLQGDFKPSGLVKIRRRDSIDMRPETRVRYMKDIENTVATWRQKQFIEVYSHLRYGFMEGCIRMNRRLVDNIEHLHITASAGVIYNS